MRWIAKGDMKQIRHLLLHAGSDSAPGCSFTEPGPIRRYSLYL